MVPPDPVPPGDPYGPGYRRYWGYYNRPFGGCGCLYSLLVLLLVLWLLSLFFPGLAFWGTWW
jgi:hypothetical protein